MRTIAGQAAAMTLLCLLMLTILPTESGAQSQDSAALDSLITSNMNAYHIPGLSARIVKAGRVAWSRNLGYADEARAVPVTDSTLFMVASVSKTFVAAAVVQLWEQDAIDLDRDINAYLPFEVVNPHHPTKPITPRMILAHTSSIAYNANAWMPLVVWGSDSPVSLQEFLASYLVPGGSRYHVANFRSYAPGSAGEYSNIAYSLAALMVEHVTGTPFEEYCRQAVFEPLQMPHTSWFLSGVNQDLVAVPTGHSGGAYFPYGHPGLPVYPAGQLRTSSDQLSRFLIAFMRGGSWGGSRILDSTSVDLMMSIQYPGTVVLPGCEWGLGWYRVSTGTSWLWMHEGGFIGMRTGIYFDPDADFGFIVLANAGDNLGFASIVSSIYEYAARLDVPTQVDLLSFTAERSGRDVDLRWEIVGKSNHRGFHIRRGIGTGAADSRRITRSPITGGESFEFIDNQAPGGSLVYWLEEEASDGRMRILGSAGVGPAPPAIGVLYSHAAPNPFNPAVTIFFGTDREARARITIHDTAGRLVAMLLDGVVPRGDHRCRWDGTDRRGRAAASGVYFYVIRLAEQVSSGRLVLAR